MYPKFLKGMRREERRVWKERGETVGVNERGENKEEWSITVHEEEIKQIMYLKDRAGQYRINDIHQQQNNF